MTVCFGYILQSAVNNVCCMYTLWDQILVGLCTYVLHCLLPGVRGLASVHLASPRRHTLSLHGIPLHSSSASSLKVRLARLLVIQNLNAVSPEREAVNLKAGLTASRAAPYLGGSTARPRAGSLTGCIHLFILQTCTVNMVFLCHLVGLAVFAASANAYSFLSCANYDRSSDTCYGTRRLGLLSKT